MLRNTVEADEIDTMISARIFRERTSKEVNIILELVKNDRSIEQFLLTNDHIECPIL